MSQAINFLFGISRQYIQTSDVTIHRFKLYTTLTTLITRWLRKASDPCETRAIIRRRLKHWFAHDMALSFSHYILQIF